VVLDHSTISPSRHHGAVLSKDVAASHMNARVILLNGKTVKENGHRIVVVRSLQDNFEVVLEF
jgi:hypothetical protein